MGEAYGLPVKYSSQLFARQSEERKEGERSQTNLHYCSKLGTIDGNSLCTQKGAAGCATSYEEASCVCARVCLCVCMCVSSKVYLAKEAGGKEYTVQTQPPAQEFLVPGLVTS